MNKELVVVIDFGGQYNQLVARRVRECNVYCEIYSYKTDLEKIKAMNPKGIILTGGKCSYLLTGVVSDGHSGTGAVLRSAADGTCTGGTSRACGSQRVW